MLVMRRIGARAQGMLLGFGAGVMLAASVFSLLLPAFDAAQLGVYLHGLAGDLAREKLGTQGLIATDVVEYLPLAFLRHGAT